MHREQYAVGGGAEKRDLEIEVGEGKKGGIKAGIPVRVRAGICRIIEIKEVCLVSVVSDLESEDKCNLMCGALGSQSKNSKWMIPYLNDGYGK